MIERLQGTDGVRKRVRPAAEVSCGPIEAFMDRGVMTEEFFELYCYAHVRDLIERGVMREGDEALIGWDSRDTKDFYTARAVAGIAKAGAVPVVLGVLPTPGVAISLVCMKAATAFMITASHNPKDQNGIKIFMGPNAMKCLPADDRRLTRRIFEADYETVRRAETGYQSFNAADEGRTRFINFHLDERNTWTKQDEPLFSKATIVVDPAHGTLTGIAAMVFAQLGFGRVVETAAELNGEVNENSGVALLEGIKEISGADFDAGAGISLHEAVRKMFAEGRGREAKEKGLPPLGAVFDADGDRFFLLFYEPRRDSVHVLSGDEALALQAEYLINTEPEKYKGSAFVHTVESDINLARHAERLGFRPVVTGVGDKWVLRKAHETPASFGVGGEETGHSIHLGIVPIFCGEEKPIFTGNGLKGAINTLVAAFRLAEGKTPAEIYSFWEEPFEPGFKRSLYSLHVDKRLFHRDSRLWKGVQEIICDVLSASSGKALSIESTFIEEEPDMLYLRIIHPKDGHVGTVFVRNSGTEEKISVNMRGPSRLEHILNEIGLRGVAYLMKNMKDLKNPMAAAELTVLEQLLRGEEPVKAHFHGIDYDRLIFDMEMKQKLIVRKEGKLLLTLLGRELVE